MPVALRWTAPAAIALLIAASVSANTSESDVKPEQGSSESAAAVTVSDESDPPDESDPSAGTPNKAEWFRQVGIGFRAGSSFRETATGGEYPAGYIIGPELQLAVFSYSIHRALIGAAYVHLGEQRSKGTYQIEVATRYQRLDLFAGYDFVWKLLTAGLRLGTTLTFVNVKTTYGEPGWEVLYDAEEPELVMYEAVDPEVSEETGVSAGFNVGLGIGLAIGRHLFGIDDLIELRAQSDYVRRGERDEFTVFGLLVFWPTRLIR